jgi:hypothetical protein
MSIRYSYAARAKYRKKVFFRYLSMILIIKCPFFRMRVQNYLSKHHNTQRRGMQVGVGMEMRD